MIIPWELLLSVSGWIFGVVSLLFAVYEIRDKKNVKKKMGEQKKSAFVENLTKKLSLILPDFPEFQLKTAVQIAVGKHLFEYIDASDTNDPNNLLNVWQETAIDVGNVVQRRAREHNAAVPDGLSEFISFSFLSSLSEEHAKAYLKDMEKNDKRIEENFARYYLSIGKSPKDLQALLDCFHSCLPEQIDDLLATLKGEEMERIARLIADQKWNRRVVERIREYVNSRQLSYNSLVNKILETNPVPKIFIVFKNEGTEQPTEEELDTRPVTSKLREMRTVEKAELISPMASIYFIKDKVVLNEFLKALPEGVDNNYVIFSAEIDPLSVNMRTSDKLEGHPAQLYMNLQRFRDLKSIYEAILLRLGIKPQEIIEKADIGFLIEPKSENLSGKLRQHSDFILKSLSDNSGRTFSLLTDLRKIDDDEVGFLGSLLVQKCGIRPSDGRNLAIQIRNEAQELYTAIYGAPPNTDQTVP